jgi:hypothetical protein
MPLPFDDDALTPNQILARYHYLGPINRGRVFRDAHGVIVVANPSSRRLPQDRWLELVRWCILSGLGSEQWRATRAWLLETFPDVTTVVSYSDPSVGHTGALYRASGWLWAPTWHRLREPPSGNGNWGTGRQASKDRWVYVLRPDRERADLLKVQDESLMKRMSWAEYREPRWKRRHALRETGGGDYARFVTSRETGTVAVSIGLHRAELAAS